MRHKHFLSSAILAVVTQIKDNFDDVNMYTGPMGEVKPNNITVGSQRLRYQYSDSFLSTVIYKFEQCGSV